MAKAKEVAFFCKECGNESAKWQGQCPVCKTWNSLVEEPKALKSAKRSSFLEGRLDHKPICITDVSTASEERFTTSISELDRVLGGGIVPGSLILVGGDPGIGKSTILLQMCQNLAMSERKVLYISGEESPRQIKMRAERMNHGEAPISLYCETNLALIEEVLRAEKPEVVVIDSIQTMYRDEVAAAPGSVSQVREATNTFLNLSKNVGITIFLVGHVTKEGTVAGPRVLEHMVDTVLYFEGERSLSYRVLRAVKNRFGSTNEIGVFEMQERGLVPVNNPSEYLLKGRPIGASGSVVTCGIEGTRPVLLEIQALVCKSNINIPRRTTTGTDVNRVQMLMAVLEKRMGVPMYACDAYVNVTGGIRVAEPALDLGIMAALISSYQDVMIPEHLVAFGEIGLAGEVRQVTMTQQRINEAAKLGFTTCMLPKVSLQKLQIPQGMKVIGVENVLDVAKGLHRVMSQEKA